MTLNYSDFDPMLKEYYSSRRVELLAMRKHPLLALIPKVENWGGNEDTFKIPKWLTSAQAVGADFDAALAQKGRGNYLRSSMTKRKRYGFAQLDRLTMKASMKDPKAFMTAFTAEVNGIKSQMGRATAANLYRNDTGLRGTVGAEAGAVITLEDREEHVNFEVGQIYVFSSDGGTTERGTWSLALHQYTLDAIDRTAGTLTFTGQDPGATSSVVAGDTIHRYGAIVTGGSFIDIQGLEDHIPKVAPTAGDSFQGIDRSVDTDRLAGLRLDGSSLSIEEALMDGGQRLAEVGKEVDKVFMNPAIFNQLQKELTTRVIHDKVKSPRNASIAFPSIKLLTAGGEVDIVPDADCQANVIWMLNMKSWVLATTGTYPQIADEDVTMLRAQNADAYEVRIAGYGNLGCYDAGSNLRIDLV